jgi:uncharacterized membrane-anchored protein
VHARPTAPITVPALVTQIAVLNGALTVADEMAHLRRLADSPGVEIDSLDPVFVHLPLPGFTLRWERHGEFSLYSVTQPLDPTDLWEVEDPDLLALVATPEGWLAGIPGHTLVALQVLVARAPQGEDGSVAGRLSLAQRFLGPGRLLGSTVKDGSAQLFTTYVLRADGTSRFLMLCEHVTEGRAGRMASGLADLETYRTLAMMSFPAARGLRPRLAKIEARLAQLTKAIDESGENGESGEEDAALLHELMLLAAEVETDITTHNTRFAATRAYYGIVRQRIDDLRGRSVPGMSGIFTFLERRMIPAMATVEATATRLSDAATHLARVADLLRTRVDITTERQNQELLRSLRRGQRTQLRLQETVEGLSIAAISYYVIGLIGYLAKGMKGLGIHVNPDLVTGGVFPFAVVGVWWTLRRAHSRVHEPGK